MSSKVISWAALIVALLTFAQVQWQNYQREREYRMLRVWIDDAREVNRAYIDDLRDWALEIDPTFKERWIP